MYGSFVLLSIIAHRGGSCQLHHSIGPFCEVKSVIYNFAMHIIIVFLTMKFKCTVNKMQDLISARKFTFLDFSYLNGVCDDLYQKVTWKLKL